MKADKAEYFDDEDEDEYMTKEELVARIKEGLEEVKLYKEGKIKLQSLKEFLDEL